MIRYMTDDDRIHSDVVNKLWQVYSEYGDQQVLLLYSEVSLCRF